MESADGVPTQDEQSREERAHDADVIRAFLEQARSLAEWHRERADAFESKAGTVLGFSGVVLTLSTFSIGPIAEVRAGWRVCLVLAFTGATIAFLLAALFAVVVIRPRDYRYASRDQLRSEWQTYRDSAGREPTQVIGMFADQLICGDQEESPIDTLANDARNRGEWLRWSIRALFVGFVFEAAVAAILAVEAAVR